MDRNPVCGKTVSDHTDWEKAVITAVFMRTTTIITEDLEGGTFDVTCFAQWTEKTVVAGFQTVGF